MAKISVKQFFARQHKIRLFSFLGLLLLLVSFSLILMNQGVKRTRAAVSCDDTNFVCTIDVSGSGAATLAGEDGKRQVTISGGGLTAPITKYLTENWDFVITGEGTVTFSDKIYARSITITDHATVTHEGLTSAETEIYGGATALRGVESDKRVDIQAETLTLTRGGHIDVNGKGYPGGASGHVDGYGPGAGVGYKSLDTTESGENEFVYAAGGSAAKGASIGIDGRGGDGSTSDPETIGSYLGYMESGVDFGFQYGSGGGYASKDDSVGGTQENDGAAGGGRVLINATTLNLYGSGAIVSANGSTASSYDYFSGTTTTKVAGGGGGGGYINIAAGTVNTLSRTVANTVAGGTSFGDPGGDGIKSSNTGYMSLFLANGGGSTDDAKFGGGGGGGYINVSAAIADACYLLPGDGDSIPAGCEGKDVVIDGFESGKYWQPGCVQNGGINGGMNACPAGYAVGLTCSVTNGYCQYRPVFFADKTRVNTQGDECTNSYDATCDSKRKFASFTISNATLTHEGLLIADAGEPGHSIVSETTKSGRWKKIEIVTTGDFIVGDNGYIDVTGQGYPGGGFAKACTSRNGTSGVQFLTSDLSIGYGPKGGGKNMGLGVTDVVAGGGGNRTAGASGKKIYEWIIPTGGKATSEPESSIDLGSGGGAAYYSDTPAGSFEFDCISGSAGGGRVKISSTGTFKMTNATARIIASGSNLHSADTHTGGDNQAYGGGGAGGTIYLSASNFEFVREGSELPSALHGLGATGILEGVVSEVNSPVLFRTYTGESPYNLIANGGNSGDGDGNSSLDYGGGGGAGWIIIRGISSGVSVHKTLSDYSLNSGETITVTLTPSGIVSAGRLTDNALKTGANKYCLIENDSDDPGGTIAPDGKSIYWDVDSDSTGEFTYDCIVQ